MDWNRLLSFFLVVLIVIGIVWGCSKRGAESANVLGLPRSEEAVTTAEYMTKAFPGEGWLAIGRRICGIESMALAQKNADLNGYNLNFVPLSKELRLVCP